ncbi:MAG: DUF488 family protein [Flavobacteriales bacterium]|nr:DUF488 family protein [Flavobacteriales bacterium]
MPFKLKRAQEPFSKSDGYRMLVDRLWPRGISKERAHLDEWNKVLPPSNELRKAFHGGELGFKAFSAAYRKELHGHPDELDRVRELAEDRTVTLLYASANVEENHARVLLTTLEGKPG